MAAPRKYNDAQRQAMFRLYEAGKTPAEIASLCEQGSAGCSPFSIPRRTVQDIVTRMAEEVEQKLPTSVAEAESAEAVERYPARIARIVNNEIERLESKQRSRRGLSSEDYDRLAKMADLSSRLEKRLSRRRTAMRKNARQGTEAQREPESALERLAREQAGAEVQPSSTHSHRESSAGGPESPPPEPPGSASPNGSEAAGQALAGLGAAERAAAAQKARQALASAAPA